MTNSTKDYLAGGAATAAGTFINDATDVLQFATLLGGLLLVLVRLGLAIREWRKVK